MEVRRNWFYVPISGQPYYSDSLWAITEGWSRLVNKASPPENSKFPCKQQVSLQIASSPADSKFPCKQGPDDVSGKLAMPVGILLLCSGC